MRWKFVGITLVFQLAAAAAEVKLELRGAIVPPREFVQVSLEGASSPFVSRTLTDSRGRFRFRNLVPGPYTLRIFIPGLTQILRTVEVSPSLAGEDRRIDVTVPYDPEAPDKQAQQSTHTVSARQLSLPSAAVREYREALALLERHQVEEAIRRLERAVKLAPRFVEAWNHLGTIAYQQRRFEDAEKFFRTALEHEPGSYVPTVNLGGVLITVGRYEEALPYNLYAVQKEPRDALAQAQLGKNYLRLGKLDPALQHLNEAKRLDPDHFSFPQLSLAEIYLRRGDLSQAATEFEDFLKRHPDAAQAATVREYLKKIKTQ